MTSRTLIASLDQVVAGARQFLSLFLASILISKENFADFAILNATSLFVLQFANYTFCLPMLVFAGGRFKDAKLRYLNVLRIADALISGLLAAAIVIYLLLRFRQFDGIDAVGFLLLCVTGNLFDLNRRAAYVGRRPDLALLASGVCTGLTLAGFYLYSRASHLGVPQILAIQSGAFLMGSFAARPRHRDIANDSASFTLREVVEAHRPYAGWELGGGLFLWLATNGLIVLAGNLLTPGEIGAYRLLTSLCGLISFPLLVAENSFTTIAAERLHEAGRQGLAEWLQEINASMRTVLLPYVLASALCCWAFVHFVLHSRYPEAERMLPAFVGYTILTLLAATGNIVLRAMALTRTICASELARALSCLIVGSMAAVLHSSLLLISALTIGAMAFLFVQQRAVHYELAD